MRRPASQAAGNGARTPSTPEAQHRTLGRSHRSLAGVATSVGLKAAAYLRHLASERLRRPRRLCVDGVVYMERSTTPVELAIAPTGPGVKEYDVRFPDAEAMRIRLTRERPYADLIPTWRTTVYQHIAELIRPGDRVLDFRCGAADGTRILVEAAGTSGAVVAIDADGESIRFARRRYPFKNVAFELADRGSAGLPSLAGELDGAFDAVVATVAPTTTPDDPVSEFWRLVRPAGHLFAIFRNGESADAAVARVRAAIGPRIRDQNKSAQLAIEAITRFAGSVLVTARASEPPPSTTQAPPQP